MILYGIYSYFYILGTMSFTNSSFSVYCNLEGGLLSISLANEKEKGGEEKM